MTSATNIQFFEYQGSRLAYRVFGNGASILLAFHGFGQDGDVFQPLEATIGDRYTVFALDLFFHGGSYQPDRQLLTKKDWQSLVAAFLRQQAVDRFSLIGFSLGGRFALATVEAFADRIDQLILIAPDGITASFWYQLATGSAVGRKVFRHGLRHLSLLNTFGHALTKLGLLNRTVMRFAEISLGTPEQRRLVFLTWTRFRLIWPDLTTTSTLLNEQSIRVQLFTGFFDRIVPGHYVLPLTKRLSRYEITVFKTGHNRLIELTAEHLAQRSL
ncbi:alpha/beta hydrolase [Spirosoma taeanense]|uniref:Alpha/beta hydrolase n=1 Tax=Spirosoma taeanense TaxID=2735870 RepID=A0A6M5YD60_9BACT|nr:alpha/beta hydrolase [Spirosoma taeanense]QJW91985.1 alpha/beta hydrolase [Spirosoma taeanense]